MVNNYPVWFLLMTLPFFNKCKKKFGKKFELPGQNVFLEAGSGSGSALRQKAGSGSGSAKNEHWFTGILFRLNVGIVPEKR